jgi:hypothetical protein
MDDVTVQMHNDLVNYLKSLEVRFKNKKHLMGDEQIEMCEHLIVTTYLQLEEMRQNINEN